MKVVIVGYGKMGRMVEKVLQSRGHTIHSRVDSGGLGDRKDLDTSALEGADGLIEFALADGIINRLKIYASSGIPAVLGTTGWDHVEKEAKALYLNTKGAILKGSNFSLGAHLFFRFTSAAAKLINHATEYDVSLVEHHHRGKADYPSGTALLAAKGILTELDRKKHIIRDLPDGPVPSDALHLSAVRVGSVPGIHEMRIDSPNDFITIKHEARDRGGFALGAVRGLEWLKNHTGWHSAEEFINDILLTPRKEN